MFKRTEMVGNEADKEDVGDFRMILPQTAG